MIPKIPKLLPILGCIKSRWTNCLRSYEAVLDIDRFVQVTSHKYDTLFEKCAERQK